MAPCPQSFARVENVKATRPDVADETQDVENVPAIRLVDSTLHRQAQQEQAHNRDEQQKAADPALLDDAVPLPESSSQLPEQGIAIAVMVSAGTGLDFSAVEFAIQMVTISRWIFPVTSADFGRTSTFTSLRTPNSGR